MIIRGIIGFVVAVLAGTTLAGCSASGERAPSAATTASVTPSATSEASSTISGAPLAPSVSASPSLPAAAQEPTREGAAAFAEYFFKVYNYAFWAADPEPLRAISDSQCVFCNSTIDRVQAVRISRSRVEGGEIQVEVAVAAPGAPANGLLVNLVLHQESGRTLSPAGERIGTTAEVRGGRADVAVRWTNGRWILLDVHLVKDGEP